MEKLIANEIGENISDNDLAKINGGIVKELLELRGMLG